MNNGYPLWATPERRAKLQELFAQNLPQFTPKFYAHLDLLMFENMSMGEYVAYLTKDVGHSQIESWKEDDRWEREFLWMLEQRRMHANPRRIGKRGGPYDSIHREQLHAERPVFEVLGIEVAAFTQHRVAKVRLTELKKIVWVDISGANLSKGKLHKLARGRGQVPEELHRMIARGVRRFL